MYVSVFKNRMFENKFLRENGVRYYSDDILPMIEVISLKIGRKKYEVDELLELFDGYFESEYFIDFFTFDEKEYKKFDISKVQFALEIRNEDNYKYFDDLLRKVSFTENGIPVISVKNIRKFLLDESILRDLILKLQKICDKVAIRINSDLLGKYFKLIDSTLRENDFLFYDINEDTIESKIFDLMSMSSRKGRYNMVLLHSPRPSEINNGSYVNGGFTGLIDNTLFVDYNLHGFDGVADYAGIKNVLPTDGGNGQGAALGLFFVKSANSFFSIVNKNTKDGAAGHVHVINELFYKYRFIIDPALDCEAIKYIDDNLKQRSSSGSWGQWKYITILRYLDQIKK